MFADYDVFALLNSAGDQVNQYQNKYNEGSRLVAQTLITREATEIDHSLAGHNEFFAFAGEVIGAASAPISLLDDSDTYSLGSRSLKVSAHSSRGTGVAWSSLIYSPQDDAGASASQFAGTLGYRSTDFD